LPPTSFSFGDITGEKLNDWMLTLEDGYTAKDGEIHKLAGPRTVHNLYTNIGCFLRFCGIDPNPNSKHSYGIRQLVGTNVPGKNDLDPEAFPEQEWTKLMFVITEERDALALQTMVLTGPREQELTHLEWFDLEFDRIDENGDPAARVWFRCKYDKQGKSMFRTKTGKGRWVPLEQGLAEKLCAWQRKNGHRKYVFGTKTDKIEGHFLRYMKDYATLSRQDPNRWWQHKCRDIFAS